MTVFIEAGSRSDAINLISSVALVSLNVVQRNVDNNLCFKNLERYQVSYKEPIKIEMHPVARCKQIAHLQIVLPETC